MDIERVPDNMSRPIGIVIAGVIAQVEHLPLKEILGPVSAWSHWHHICTGEVAGNSIVCSIVVQASNEEVSKSHIIGPSWVESKCDQWIHIAKGQQCGRRFLIMTSSCHD